VVKCKSKNDNIYYRCSSRCEKFWFEDAYELYLRDNHLLEAPGATASVRVVQQPIPTVVQGFQQAFADLKIVEFDLKMQLGDMRVKIENLKSEMKDLKDKVRKGKNGIVVDNAVAIGVILAMFVALLVAIVWKK
jgi:hypothetical protein